MLKAILKGLRLAVTLPPSPPSEGDVEGYVRALSREIVSSCGRGNITLQEGNLITDDDIMSLKKSLS